MMMRPPMPIPAAMVEPMAETNWAQGTSIDVVPASAPTVIAVAVNARKWLVRCVCVVVAVLMTMMWITAPAYGDNSDGGSTDTNSSSNDGSSSDSSGNSDSGVTITENITDTQNLLGSHVSEVSDAVANTERETGVHVHLLYLPTFGTKLAPQKWAKNVLESMEPKPNTVLLAVASNDGNLVVAVSSNSDEWLKSQDTVDKLSEAAQQPLMESTPNWAGSATAMMDQIVKSQKTSTSSSSVRIGIIVMAAVLVVLVIVVVLMVVIRVRSGGRKPRRASKEPLSRRERKARKQAREQARKELQGDIQETPRRTRHSRKHE